MLEQKVEANVFALVGGEPKTGKTHLALTFREPIKLFSFDLGYKQVVAKFPGKKIDVVEYPMIVVDTLELKDAGFQKLWKTVRDDLYKTYEEGKYKTIVIDTATALWEIVRYAFNEEQDKAVGAGGKARNYGEPNSRFYGLIMRAQVAGINLVLTEYLKDEWLNDAPTGNKILEGWRRAAGLADIVLVTERIQRVATPEERKAMGNTKTNAIKTTVKDCRFDLDMCGFNQENMCYDDLVALLGL